MAIETNLNQSPFFDDFDETKNFHRVLFRPGFAVQARELTQLQTILQNQIERFANEVVVDGTVITGVGLKTDTIDFVKLRDKDANNRVLLLGDFFESGVVANATVTGATTGITAQLIDAKEGSEAADPNFLSIFVKYTNSTNKVTAFTVSSTLDADAGTGYSNGDVIKVNGGVGVSANATVTTGASNTSVVSLTVVDGGSYTTFPLLTGAPTTAETGSGTGLKVDLTMTSYKTFADNEVLNVRRRSNTEFLVAANTITSSATGQGFRATVSDGIVYHKGHFIRVAPQSHIVEKYSITPSKKIGFITAESTVDSNEDSSLLDNSTGSTNFAAPGAERLKLLPTLSSRDLTAANTTTFFTIATVENGSVIQRRTDTTYSDLGQYIAQRSFETNGNYATEPFNIRIREHLRSTTNLGRYNLDGGGDNNKLVAEVEKGVGYVNGNRVSIESPVFRDVDKATDFETKDARVIGQAIGNYVFVKEVVGTWDFQGLREVSLRDAVQNGVSGKDYGAQSAQGSEIGTAKIRGIAYESGATGTVEGRVRLYIFDIQMNSGSSFSDVRGIYENNASGPKSMADLVLESGIAVLKESGKNTLVFPFTQKGTKTLKDADNNVDTQFVFATEATIQFSGGSGTVPVSSNGAHAGGTESMNDTGTLTLADRRNIFVVAKAQVDTADHTGTITDIAGNTITGSSTTFASTYAVGDMIKITDGGNTYTEIVSEITSDTILKTIGAIAVTRTGATLGHATRFPTGRVFDSANLNITSTSGQHSIDIVPLQNTATSFSTSVYYNVLRTDAVQTAKTVNKSKYIHIDTGSHSASKNGPWSLGVSDAYQLEAVYVGGNTTVTAANNNLTEFELVTGQKDAYYDTSSFKLKDTSSLDLTNRGLLVKFSYFGRDRSSGIGYLSVDSYPVDDANTANTTAVTTQNIPRFVSPTTGVTYDLRDSIDFRPIKSNSRTPSANAVAVQTPSITNPDANTAFNIDSDGAYMPTPDENFQTDVQFYLPRKDRVVLTKEGNVEVIKGVPSLSPKTPSERGESMSLGTLDIPVYPSLSPHVAKQAGRQDYAVRLTLDNNRRYTMKDLRAVEERVKNLEYYASLNALESSAKNKQIFGSTGIDRFKNGFLVDNFDGHNRADTTQTGYRAAIDRNRNQLRPSYVRRDVSLSKDVSFTSSNVTQRGNLITLSFTDTSQLSQPFASKLRNPVQELTFNWVGEVLLNPSMDNTPDITELPDIQVDFDGMYQAFEEIASATGVTGIDWGNWTTTSTDRDVDRQGDTTTTTVTTEQIRQGIQTSISPSGELFSDGNFVQNVAVRDFMRSRNVEVTGVRMKPNTRVYPYFDDELVADYVTPANSSFANTAAEGSSLVTDSSGTVYANFRIPNDDTLKFRIGTKRFEFKDIANTQTQSALLTTSSHGDYTSIPLSVSTRGMSFINLPQLSRNNVSDDRTLRTVTRVERNNRGNDENRGGDGRTSDPLSQTFTISAGDSEGVFITKLDLYFGRKSSTYPITVQIREVENGFPTPTILPFGSKTLQPSEVVANSIVATNATTFQFDSPVFLKNGTDYTFTVLPAGNSDEYALWVGALGGTDVDTNELIHKQPAAGIMFTSADNKTWSPIQSEDVKFNLYRANFTTSAGTLYIENDDIDFFSYSTLNGTFNVGEKVTNGVDPTPASGFVKFIDTANKKIHIESSTGGFGSANTITGAVSGATAQLSSIDNVVMNTLVPKLPSLSYANTSLAFSARTTSTSGVISPSFVTIDNEVENDFLDGEKKVYSKTNESGLSAVNGSQKSLVIKGTLSTTDPKVSPIIDTARTNGIVIENVINNLITDEHKTVGDANMRYITKPVELADGQDAEDLKVFLTAYKPSGAGVDVYARIHNPEDGENFNDKDFTPLTQITASNTFSDSVDRTDLREFEFGFSANTDGQGFLTTANSHARLNSSNNEVVTYRATDGSIYATYKTFALKIVLTSTGTNIVPLVNDLRAIALQK